MPAAHYIMEWKRFSHYLPFMWESTRNRWISHIMGSNVSREYLSQYKSYLRDTNEMIMIKQTEILRKKVSRLRLHEMRVLKYYVENKSQLETWKWGKRK